MITRIRDVRRAKKLTLQEVAKRCDPPTTPQTIGRLETGTRTVSVTWLARIAKALGVDASELVELPQREDVPVAAVLGGNGAQAPRRPRLALPPQLARGLVAVAVESGVGDYRAGDELWMERLAPEAFARAMNRDVLVPRPAGRFVFGRLIGRDPGKLQLLTLGSGGRQTVLSDPPWIAVATRLIRTL